METTLRGPCHGSLLPFTAEPSEPYLWLLVSLLRGWVCFSVYDSFGYQHVRMLKFGLLNGQSQGLVENISKVRSHRISNTRDYRDQQATSAQLVEQVAQGGAVVQELKEPESSSSS